VSRLREALPGDLVAGFSVALVGLPQCLAYSLLAGLPPAYGLSTAVVAGLVAALLGRSVQVAAGPTNTTSLLILAALLPALGPNGLIPSERLPLVATLTLLAGALRLLASLVGGAQLVRFMPESVLVGFTSGAGILIGTMQLDEALGLSGVRAHGLVSELRALAPGLPGAGWPAVLVCTATASLLLVAARRVSPRVPLALLCVVASGAAALVLGLDRSSGLPLVGERALIPSTWPPGAWPSLDPALLQQLLVPASAIALLGTLELAVTSRAGGVRVELKREIVAHGWANVAGAFSACIPASASLTRSALLRAGLPRTRLAPASAALFTLLMLLGAGRFVGHVPEACLAGVLLATAWRMIDRDAIRRLWRASAETRLLLMLTLLGTLVLPIEWAVLLGSGTGLVIHLANTSAPRLRLLRPADGRLVPAAAGETPAVVVLEVSGNLHYAAVPPFVSEAERLLPPAARLVVVDLSHAHEIRFTALRAFEQLADEIAREGGVLWLAGVDQDTQALVARSGSTLRVMPAEVEPGLSVRRCLEAAARP
jgi:SulP family sulfate permease